MMMLPSLSNRIAMIGLVVVLALASLAGILSDASYETRNSFRWVTHSAEVIETTEAALVSLREAESEQRGFVVTHDPSYASFFAERLANAKRSMARVAVLVDDNRIQYGRIRIIANLVDQRAISLAQPLALSRRGDFAAATAIIASGRGRALTEAITDHMQVFLSEERNLQASRADAADARLRAGQTIALFGASVVALLVMAGAWLLVRSIRRPLDTILRAMADLGSGDGTGRIDTAMGSREFDRLGTGYNAMADRLEQALGEQARGEQRLQDVNGELHRNSLALRERGDVIELLGGMAHRMQAARTDEELAQIVRVFVPRVLPGIPGALYAHNHSRNLLSPVAGWGGLAVLEDGFAPDQCWALRRGQSHHVTEPGGDIVCAHVTEGEVYHCEPLLAGGEVIGVLYLQGSIEAEGRFRLTVLSENIASALVNHRLQRSLREQTIRDPLTNLFNRRYMEEALTLEIARAGRSGTPLSLVMCDIDHFKRFNDDYGHDAGDAVLQAVATEMRARFRDGDVVCRFGGEEFTVIAPGTTADALLGRVELVREAIAEICLIQGGRTLGTTSMSFGIATWNDTMARDGSSLIKAADMALYEAKRAGRNRTTISRLAA